jgi:translation initiation factor 2 beta subunit (eIF-2beta)/eIF-5
MQSDEELFWKHFDQMFEKLSRDEIILRNEISKNDSQTFRRAYCRAIFSMIEGISSLLKQHAEKFGDTDEKTMLLLQDKKIKSDQNGVIQKHTSFMRAFDNAFFSLETFAWTQDCEPYLKKTQRVGENLRNQ